MWQRACQHDRLPRFPRLHRWAFQAKVNNRDLPGRPEVIEQWRLDERAAYDAHMNAIRREIDETKAIILEAKAREEWLKGDEIPL